MDLVIDYVEIPVSDLEASKRFYADALGWAFNDYGPEYAGVRDPRNDGEEFAGLSAQPVEDARRGVLALVRTDDIEAALQRITTAGGSVRIPLHEYPGGRRFTFEDLSGNELGVYQPAH